MSRRFLVVLLLHHIDGVCKPLSVVKQAANLAVTQIISGIASAADRRDREAAVQRASERQEAAIERDRVAGARRRRPAVRQHDPAAIDPPPVVPGWAPSVRETQEPTR